MFYSSVHVANCERCLSFTICVAKRAFGRLPQTATIRSLVCSCEMRPFAFRESRAFFNTDPDFRAQIELNERVGLKS